VSLDARGSRCEMTLGINAFVVSATIFKYNESVVFSISRVRPLHWQRSQRSRWACPHGEERGEKHGDNREECRAQCGQGHKEGCAHCGLHVHAIVEAWWLRLRQCFCGVIRLSVRRSAIRRSTVSNRNYWKLSNPGSLFSFLGE
jgi:hypothetical protein